MPALVWQLLQPHVPTDHLKCGLCHREKLDFLVYVILTNIQFHEATCYHTEQRRFTGFPDNYIGFEKFIKTLSLHAFSFYLIYKTLNSK